MSETYTRAVFTAPETIRLDELPLPEPGPREALVKVKACALCTWEQRMYTGEEHYYPLAGGHEISGELVKLGERVFMDVEPGDKVVAGPLTRCGYCPACTRGLNNICDNALKAYAGRDVPGPAGLAEYILVKDNQLYAAQGEASFEALALSEPLACVIRSVRAAKVERADDVVVVGAGIMGLIHLLLVKQSGARVIVSEPNKERADYARKLGAAAIIDPSDGSFVEQVMDLTKKRGADVIFNAVSVAAAVEQSVAALAKGGRSLVYASIYPKPAKITIDPNLFHKKEITLTGTLSQSRQEVQQAVDMIAKGLIDMSPLVSKTFPFNELEEGLKAALKPDTYRVLVEM
jgi:L-iditol 2-dehydrogenase